MNAVPAPNPGGTNLDAINRLIAHTREMRLSTLEKSIQSIVDSFTLLIQCLKVPPEGPAVTSQLAEAELRGLKSQLAAETIVQQVHSLMSLVEDLKMDIALNDFVRLDELVDLREPTVREDLVAVSGDVTLFLRQVMRGYKAKKDAADSAVAEEAREPVVVAPRKEKKRKREVGEQEQEEGAEEDDT